MRRYATLSALLFAIFALFYLTATTPDPRGSGEGFLALKAKADDAAMASVPHPIGSVQNAKVRDYLLGRMADLGLKPETHTGFGVNSREFQGRTYAEAGPVENLVGVLPGKDPGLPALMLMAHYDSVPGSPGAADDAAGVSSILEIVRCLKAQGTPERDVIILITDGEEAGLLGADAFFHDDPLAKRVGFIINQEARGGGGRAAMFQTGPDDAGIINTFRKADPHAVSSSAQTFIYKHLPNDTDMTPALAAGYTGVNFAFIGRQFDYHSPSSTPANLDLGALQDMGDQTLGVARAVAFARALPAKGANLVYADVMGLCILAYPPWLGWALIAAAALLLWAAHRRAGKAVKTGDIAIGALAGLLVPAGAGLALWAARLATGAGFGFIEQRPLLARFPIFEVAMAFTALGVLLLAARLSQGKRSRPGFWLGLLALVGVLAIVAQALAAELAFIFAWPLLVGALAAALTAAGEKRAGLPGFLHLALAVVAGAWLLTLFHNFLEALDIPAVGALPALLFAAVLWPLLTPATGKPGWTPALSALAVGFGVALALRITSPWTERHPRPEGLFYVTDARTGQSRRVDSETPGDWARGVLTADGGKVGPYSFPGFEEKDWAAAARPVPANPPAFTGDAAGLGVDPPHDVAELVLRIQPDQALADVRLNDQKIADRVAAGKPFLVSISHPYREFMAPGQPAALRVTSKAPPGTRLHIAYAAYQDGWPQGAAPLPAKPDKVELFGRAGSSVTVGELDVR
jgi:Peptidase family M28